MHHLEVVRAVAAVSESDGAGCETDRAGAVENRGVVAIFFRHDGVDVVGWIRHGSGFYVDSSRGSWVERQDSIREEIVSSESMIKSNFRPTVIIPSQPKYHRLANIRLKFHGLVWLSLWLWQRVQGVERPFRSSKAASSEHETAPRLTEENFARTVLQHIFRVRNTVFPWS